MVAGIVLDQVLGWIHSRRIHRGQPLVTWDMIKSSLNSLLKADHYDGYAPPLMAMTATQEMGKAYNAVHRGTTRGHEKSGWHRT